MSSLIYSLDSLVDLTAVRSPDLFPDDSHCDMIRFSFLNGHCSDDGYVIKQLWLSQRIAWNSGKENPMNAETDALFEVVLYINQLKPFTEQSRC